VPELTISLKAAEECPDQHPTQDQYGGFAGRQMQGVENSQGRDKPHPAEHIPPQSARLRERLTFTVYDADVPGFHGQGLAFVPEPGEIDAKHQEDERLQTVSVVQCVAGLAEGAEEVTADEDHAKQQQAFVQPASHTP